MYRFTVIYHTDIIKKGKRHMDKRTSKIQCAQEGLS